MRVARAHYPPAFRVNWHLAHSLRHGEDVETAYRHVRGRVVHVHFGFSEKPETMAAVERQCELLFLDGYEGYFSLEIIRKGDNEDLLVDAAKRWQRLKFKLEARWSPKAPKAPKGPR